MRRLANVIPVFCCMCGIMLYLYVLPLASVTRLQHEQLFNLPAKLLRVVSGQFKEVAADLSFLNAHTYLGGAKTQSDTRRYLPEQYEWILGSLKNSAALDPYFIDVYYLMNSALIWDSYKLNEVNDLIAKGADTITWDQYLPFFAGFNYYYFLDNSEKGFNYLREASRRSGGNPFYDRLASRIAYKANKTELAIMYLEEQIKQAELQGLKGTMRDVEKRLEVLKGIKVIEAAVLTYQNLFGKLPIDIDELVKLGVLITIPKEPSGGSYYLDSSGKAKSTKDLN